MFNLSGLLKKEIGCQMIGLPIVIGPIPPIGFSIKDPKALMVHNVYWEEIPEKSNGKFKIKGSLTSYCGKENSELKINRNHKFTISFKIKDTYSADLNKWIIDEKTIKITQTKEPWIRLLDWGY
jgi:hypothetical protein